MAIKGIPNSPKLRHYWNLTIRLFCFISRTTVAGVGYPFAEKFFGVFNCPSRLGNTQDVTLINKNRISSVVYVIRKFKPFIA